MTKPKLDYSRCHPRNAEMRRLFDLLKKLGACPEEVEVAMAREFACVAVSTASLSSVAWLTRSLLCGGSFNRLHADFVSFRASHRDMNSYELSHELRIDRCARCIKKLKKLGIIREKG